jgi:dTDP-4-dehydrorhamnose reductase
MYLIFGSGALALTLYFKLLDLSESVLLVSESKPKLGEQPLPVISRAYLEGNHKLLGDRPVLINTVALTDVDHCEEDPILAFNLNTKFVIETYQKFKQFNPLLVQISTDQLFSDKCLYHSEAARPSPINIYGTTKYLAELIVSSVKAHVIVRTNFFGVTPIGKKSNIESLIKVVAEGSQARLTTEIYTTAIHIDFLVEQLIFLIKSGATGLFNIASHERLSRYDFGRLLTGYMNVDYETVLTPVSNECLGFRARRPNEMGLSNKKILNAIGIQVPPITAQLEHHLRTRLSSKVGQVQYG